MGDGLNNSLAFLYAYFIFYFLANCGTVRQVDENAEKAHIVPLSQMIFSINSKKTF